MEAPVDVWLDGSSEHVVVVTLPAGGEVALAEVDPDQAFPDELDLFRQGLLSNGKGAPQELIARHEKGVGFLSARKQKQQGLIACQRAFGFLQREWLRLRQ